MKKLLIIFLFFPLFVNAQNPVVQSSPYKFLKWVQVFGSLYADSVLLPSDSSNRVATTQWVRQNKTAIIKLKIPEGSTWPYNYSYTNSTQPGATFLISSGGSLTGNGTNGMYFILSGGVMSIYGNNDGSNHFNEDTYVRISP